MLKDEYNQYWRTVIETMPDGLLVVDPKGVIVLVNGTLEALIGYSKNELIGKSCAILGCDVCTSEKKHGNGEYCALFREETIRRFKCQIRQKDGSMLPVIKNASVLKDLDGKVIGGVETLTDISEVMQKERVISNLRKELNVQNSFHGIIGISPSMHQIFDLISSAAQSDAPVIIYGESGTGKELVAKAIHNIGICREGPFIRVNCAALNESLLESELFGHVKGAFTGAGQTRIGRFEAANGGDIFLDEVGDIPLSIQVKLLRVLQEKEIERVGDHRPIAIDARIISATNKDLKQLKESGHFREDLFYRIGVIPIHLPPLRERREDIPLLINTFINRIRQKTEKSIFGMSSEAFEALKSYTWLGNIRELINMIEYAFVLCPGGEIMPEHLPHELFGKQCQRNPLAHVSCLQSPTDERKRLLQALEQVGGNKTKASRLLGISRVSLYKKLQKYDVRVDKTISE